jgi:hypothetical protein
MQSKMKRSEEEEEAAYDALLTKDRMTKRV